MPTRGRAPNPFRGSDDEWRAWMRDVPPWGFDRHFVAELAADHLHRVRGEMSLSEEIGRLARAPSEVIPLSAMWLAPFGRWMLLRLDEEPRDLIALDTWAHAWSCPALDRAGRDLIDLGAWRWGVSHSKAAFRIARLCGRRRPVP
jgi:hypothetical protein